MLKKYFLFYFIVSLIEVIILMFDSRYLNYLFVSNVLLLLCSLILLVCTFKKKYENKKKDLFVILLCILFQCLSLVTIIIYLTFYEVSVVREVFYIFPGLIKYEEYQLNPDFSKEYIRTYYNVYFNFIGSALLLLLVNARRKAINKN